MSKENHPPDFNVREEIKVGDIVDTGTYRYWVVLEVTQDMFDNTNIDVERPGLYLFGGMWYGYEPMDVKSFGKVIDPTYCERLVRVTTVENVNDTNKVRRLVN